MKDLRDDSTKASDPAANTPLGPEEASLAEQRAGLSAVLGLDEPVPEAVLHSAVDDEAYAKNLLVSRGDPEFLDMLIASPPHVKTQKTGPELVRAAAKAMLRWAKTGFSTVDDATFAARIAACASCPNLANPPREQGGLYRMAGGSVDQRSICRLCGCVVAVKARRVSETCPDGSPDKRGQTRWDASTI